MASATEAIDLCLTESSDDEAAVHRPTPPRSAPNVLNVRRKEKKKSPNQQTPVARQDGITTAATTPASPTESTSRKSSLQSSTITTTTTNEIARPPTGRFRKQAARKTVSRPRPVDLPATAVRKKTSETRRRLHPDLLSHIAEDDTTSSSSKPASAPSTPQKERQRTTKEPSSRDRRTRESPIERWLQRNTTSENQKASTALQEGEPTSQVKAATTPLLQQGRATLATDPTDDSIATASVPPAKGPQNPTFASSEASKQDYNVMAALDQYRQNDQTAEANASLKHASLAPPATDSIEDIESSSDDGSSSGDEESSQAVTNDFLKCHCWKCHVELQHPENDESDVMICYALHAHPILKIPVCCICSAEADALLQASPDDRTVSCTLCGKSEDESDEETETYFGCKDCDRLVCGTCIVQAYQQEDIVEELSNRKGPWTCCCCQPPTPLMELQKEVQDLQQAPTQTKSIETLLEELDCVEGKKRECIARLEDTMATKLRISQEIIRNQENSPVTYSELQDMIEDEFEAWRNEQTRHDWRLDDMIATLHDDLERLGYDLKEYYMSELSQGDVEDPSWKQSADREVETRISTKKNLLSRLQLREESLGQCNDRLKNSRRKRLEIREKLERDNPSESSSALQARVNLEFKAWKSSELSKKHKWEEEIDSLYSKMEYQGFNKKEFIRAKLAATRQADSDIEDLGSLGSDDEHRTMEELERRLEGGWVTNIVSKAEVRMALAAENAAHRNRHVTAVSDADDLNAMVVEDRRRSRARVRLDHVSLREEQKKESERTVARRTSRIGRGKNGARRNSQHASKDDDDHSVMSIESSVSEPMDDDDSAKALSLFQNSSLVLSEGDTDKLYSCSVATPLAEKLKQHQRDGIEFMFRNSFSDLVHKDEQNAGEINMNQIGGCILAHNMGLGKSLSCVALLHMLCCHPSFNPPIRPRPINSILLLVPTVTVTNWEDEFAKWVGDYEPRLAVYTLGEDKKRKSVIKKWHERGGVLLLSIGIWQRHTKDKSSEFIQWLQDPGPDVLVLDEAHQMLKNKSNKTFHALNFVKTKRRICLTGSPFQNNLLEYFRMVSYVRCGILGRSESDFQREFVTPIVEGNVSDASDYEKQLADEKLAQIQQLVKPHVHRVDRKALLRDLPPMQQVVVHLRQTKVQSQLYSAFKKYVKRSGNSDNFFYVYHELRPIHNHPGALLKKAEKRSSILSSTLPSPKEIDSKQRRSSNLATSGSSTIPAKEADSKEALVKKAPAEAETTGATPKKASAFQEIIDLLSDSEEDDVTISSKEAPVDDASISSKEAARDHRHWWDYRKDRGSDLSDIINGNKVVALLHILVNADVVDDKVVVFSQCLKTLDFLSDVFATPNWYKHVPSLASAFPDSRHGGWRSGREFLRIDGSKSSTERGEMVKEFNADLSSVKVFLISPRAGGVGINLCAANRVVLFDSNFNPTTDEQALYRCYRYGQTKSVFVYRLLVEGTMEEKVYSRAVGKSSLALRLLDSKNIDRVFTRKEIQDLTTNYEWVCCDRCNKWRVFPPECNIDSEQLPEQWFCEMMNEHDQRMVHDCKFSEKGQAWYDAHFAKPNEPPLVDGTVSVIGTFGDKLPSEKEMQLTDRDAVLKGLLNVEANENSSRIVSRHYFHDVLLEEKDLEEAAAASPMSIDPSLSASPQAKNAEQPAKVVNITESSASVLSDQSDSETWADARDAAKSSSPSVNVATNQGVTKKRSLSTDNFLSGGAEMDAKIPAVSRPGKSPEKSPPEVFGTPGTVATPSSTFTARTSNRKRSREASPATSRADTENEQGSTSRRSKRLFRQNSAKSSEEGSDEESSGSGGRLGRLFPKRTAPKKRSLLGKLIDTLKM